MFSIYSFISILSLSILLAFEFTIHRLFDAKMIETNEINRWIWSFDFSKTMRHDNAFLMNRLMEKKEIWSDWAEFYIFKTLLIDRRKLLTLMHFESRINRINFIHVSGNWWIRLENLWPIIAYTNIYLFCLFLRVDRPAQSIHRCLLNCNKHFVFSNLFCSYTRVIHGNGVWCIIYLIDFGAHSNNRDHSKLVVRNY